MNTTLTVDKAGRVVLPKPVRDEMQLRAGDSLELESFGRPHCAPPTQGRVADCARSKASGFSAPANRFRRKLPNEVLRQIRRERELSFLGSGPSASRSTEEATGEMVLRQLRLGAGALCQIMCTTLAAFAAFAAASRKNAGCAAHSLAEVYSTLTRYPGKTTPKR